MTIEEFNKTRWGAGMLAEYHGNTYPIVSCDFEEALVALKGAVGGTEDSLWVRCENIKLVSASQPQAMPKPYRAVRTY